MNPILFLIIFIPVIEIYLFIIGAQIGALSTILLIFSAAILGIFMQNMKV